MTKTEFLAQLSAAAVDSEKTKAVGTVYKGELPDIIQKIITCCNETVFFDNTRILAYEEILCAPQELHVDFDVRHLIPIADQGDNDFVVYHMVEKKWYLFNIIDKTLFKERSTFQELI